MNMRKIIAVMIIGLLGTIEASFAGPSWVFTLSIGRMFQLKSLGRKKMVYGVKIGLRER